MVEIKVQLKDRIPSLYEPMRHLRRKRDLTSSEDWMLLTILTGNDLTLEMSFSYIDSRYVEKSKDILLKIMPELIDIAKRHSDVGNALKEYLPRLQKFSERDERLQKMYNAYQEAFGGQQ